MAAIGRDHGLNTVIAPVRPSWKHRYPLTPIDRYLLWRRSDGAHLDPWLRTHERLGGDIVKPTPKSVVVTGSVVEWEEWTQMAFPESGAYVVPGALAPIEIERERDEGVHVEPNVWMVHPPPPATKPRLLACASGRECRSSDVAPVDAAARAPGPSRSAPQAHHWRAIATRKRSSAVIRWSASSASSPRSICTQSTLPLNSLSVGP